MNIHRICLNWSVAGVIVTITKENPKENEDSIGRFKAKSYMLENLDSAFKFIKEELKKKLLDKQPEVI